MKQENEKILMSVKCSGYFCYKNEKEYRQISNLLKKNTQGDRLSLCDTADEMEIK